MKAFTYDRYGTADRLTLEEVATPMPTDDQLLIRIHAVSLNGSDREGLAGRPLYSRMGGLLKPSDRILGSDIAGRVEQVGKNVTEFKVGDELFGELPGYRGGLAEFVCTSGKTMAHKPPSLSFEEAAAIPQAGVIAFNAIRKHGKLQPGQRLLINGAGGSAGTFALQLARLHGAEITVVDHASKLDFLRSLGADHVVDYTRDAFVRGSRHYDLIVDLMAHRSPLRVQRVLKAEGRYLFVGGSVGVLLQLLLLGPLLHKATGKRLQLLGVPQNRPDLLAVTELCERREIVPIIDRCYPFDQTPAALRALSEGRARGKIVIRVLPGTP